MDHRLEVGDYAWLPINITVNEALERKRGVIELLQQEQSDKIAIKVSRRGDNGDLIRLPKTALDTKWRYARPVTNPGG